MPFLPESRFTIVSACLVALFAAADSNAAMDPRFEIDPRSLVSPAPTAKTHGGIYKQSARSSFGKDSHSSGKGTSYTVKAGDHLFKILMRDYGLSNNEAESFIEEIRRENNIYDIKRLKIGQKIIIPPVRRRADGSLKLIQPVNLPMESPAGQTLVLESPLPKFDSHEALVKLRETWDKVIPQKVDQQPISLQTTSFSLSLDPQRYPTFSAMNGTRILLDQHSSIPPLVKSLIEEKDPSIRIVSYSDASTKQFVSTMLEAAGFYSVEENFTLDFGTDPKLTVRADFKIEKTPESLIKHDVVLMNSGHVSMPSELNNFLNKEGFTLYEPFASIKSSPSHEAYPIHVITAKNQSGMVDEILTALSVPAVRDHRLDVFAADNNGISLAVKAERYFERGGQRYIITRFDGDPVNYTLFRILETKGYRVVILEAQDDFRKVSEKIVSRMKINGSFSQHSLLKDRSLGYSLQMSGVKVDDNSLPGGGLFLTNLTIDRIIRDLLTENGYRFNNL